MASTPRLPAFAEAVIPPSEIALPGRFDAIGDAGDWLAAWLAPRAVPEETAFAMRLCLEEALANIVMHGKSDGMATIDAVLTEEPGLLVLWISDDGIPFDPVTAALPESQEIGGNGLLLLRRYCSGLHYGREEGRNRLTLQFRLADGMSAPGR